MAESSDPKETKQLTSGEEGGSKKFLDKVKDSYVCAEESRHRRGQGL